MLAFNSNTFSKNSHETSSILMNSVLQQTVKLIQSRISYTSVVRRVIIPRKKRIFQSIPTYEGAKLLHFTCCWKRRSTSTTHSSGFVSRGILILYISGLNLKLCSHSARFRLQAGEPISEIKQVEFTISPSYRK